MKISFLGQGFEEQSIDAVGNHIIRFLASSNFNSFTCISAFASESGVFGLASHLNPSKANFKEITLVVGVDLQGTSKEALEEILALNINSYIFYQKEQPIFHPKIYLFEGDSEFKIIVGSSNLTRGGLFTNVESSMLIEFDSTDKDGLKLMNELKGYYKSLFDFSDPNLFKISTKVIDDFYADGIIPDEKTRSLNFNKKTSPGDPSLPSATKKVLLTKRTPAKVPAAFPMKPKKVSMLSPIAAHAVAPISTVSIPAKVNTVMHVTRPLLWESGPLTERDLSIPTGSNTNQTGSILFKKGRTLGIDQRTYFRHVVFNKLAWALDAAPRTSHIERSTTFFRIIIMGTDHGVFPLSLSHNTKTNTKTYLQNNSMTSLSWGKAKILVAHTNLIGKSAKLYEDTIVPNQFILEIS
ncbi:phospholipase D family protein [Pedobacter ginsengisoli]|uniref:phospholipase D family protein n=1 Tax=Pedobacter ginsengisoli TaxID=363852 RepID=UPI002550E8EA|nr:phospholipase D family protein [Pedobacter ginsengisoli]